MNTRAAPTHAYCLNCGHATEHDSDGRCLEKDCAFLSPSLAIRASIPVSQRVKFTAEFQKLHEIVDQTPYWKR